MTNRRDLLDEALCLIDDDLLDKALASRPLREGRAPRLVRICGRQMPALLASAVAVAILVVGLSAIPGLVRMAGLIAGMVPGGIPSVSETEDNPPTSTTPSVSETEDDPPTSTTSSVSETEENPPPSTTPWSLVINGKPIDCGENPPRDGEWNILLPITVTYHALGMEIGEVTDGQVKITYEEATYILSITEKTLIREDGDLDGDLLALLAPDDCRMEEGKDELMMDYRTLENTLKYIMGNGDQWDFSWDSAEKQFYINHRHILDHTHSYSPWVPWEEKHERHCQAPSCTAQEFEPHLWQLTTGADGKNIHLCPVCHMEKEAEDNTVVEHIPPHGYLTFTVSPIRYLVDGYEITSESAPSVLMNGPIVTTLDGWTVPSSHWRVPLLATLRALGATVTDADGHTKEITYRDTVWILDLTPENPRMYAKDNASEQILHIAPTVGYIGVSSDGEELVVDSSTLWQQILVHMEGQKKRWVIEHGDGFIHLMPMDSSSKPPMTTETVTKITVSYTSGTDAQTRIFTSHDKIDAILRQFNKTGYSIASDSPNKYPDLSTLEITIFYANQNISVEEKRILRGDRFFGFGTDDGRVSWRDISPEDGQALMDVLLMEGN